LENGLPLGQIGRGKRKAVKKRVCEQTYWNSGRREELRCQGLQKSALVSLIAPDYIVVNSPLAHPRRCRQPAKT
jgi:hypothetical protein